MKQLTDITAGPRSPNERATANTASTASVCTKQRPALMGSPKGIVPSPHWVERRLQGEQAGTDGPALLCAGTPLGPLGIQGLTDRLQRGERISRLGAAPLRARGLAQDVQRLGEVIPAVLDVMPGSAIRVEERALTFPLAHRAIELPALVVGVGGPHPPVHRRCGASRRAGSQHDDAYEDQAAKDGPQPDEVEAGSAGRCPRTARRCDRRRAACRRPWSRGALSWVG